MSGNVRPGQSFKPSANDWNAFHEATRFVRERVRHDHAKPDRFSEDANIFKIKNTTAADLVSHSVLEIDAPLYDDTDNLLEFKFRTAFKGIVPTPSGTDGRWCITRDQIAIGKIRDATFSGVTPVQINVSDVTHKFAEAAVGVTANLISKNHGTARILWPKTLLVGTQWCVIRFDGVGSGTGVIPFTLTQSLPLGGTANATNDDTGAAIQVTDTFTAPGKFSGPINYVGFARLHPTNQTYEIINMDRQARFIQATLTADMVAGSATATVADFWDGVSPVGSVTVEDRCDIAGSATQGDCVLCCWDDKAEVYVVLTADAAGEIIPFTLTAALALGGFANATNDLNGQAIVVVDVFTSPGKFSGPIGFIGFARENDSTNRYEIIAMDRWARSIRVTITEDMGAATVNQASATVSAAVDGVAPASPLVIRDTCVHYSKSKLGACFNCTYDDVADIYFIVDGPQTSHEVLEMCVIGDGLYTRTNTLNVTKLEINSYSGLQAWRQNADNSIALIRLGSTGDGNKITQIPGTGGDRMLSFTNIGDAIQTDAPSVGEKFTALGTMNPCGWFESQSGGGDVFPAEGNRTACNVYFGGAGGAINRNDPRSLYIRTGPLVFDETGMVVEPIGSGAHRFVFAADDATITESYQCLEEGWINTKSGTFTAVHPQGGNVSLTIVAGVIVGGSGWTQEEFDGPDAYTPTCANFENQYPGC